MKRIVREEARRLRKEGMSIRDIAQTLNVSKSSVSLWVRDIELTPYQIEKLRREQHSYEAHIAGARANRAKGRERRQIYQQQGREKAREGNPLHMSGCMLYWAEGAKERYQVCFVNSDPNMMVFFIRFLREAMHVSDEAMCLRVHCHTQDVSEQRRIETYWLHLLKLPDAALRKTIYKVGSESSRKTLVNGICSLTIYKTAVLHHIYGAIQEYAGFDNPDWLF